MCRTMLKYRGAGPTLLVVAVLWLIAIAIGIAIDIPPGNVMQACATILVGGLIPVLYYHLITRPAERGSALKKATSEELGSIVEGLGILATELQLAVDHSEYARIRGIIGYRAHHLSARLRAMFLHVTNTTDIRDATNYLINISEGIEEIQETIRKVGPHSSHAKVNQDIHEAITIVYYNHLAYVMYLHGSISNPISLEDFRKLDSYET